MPKMCADGWTSGRIGRGTRSRSSSSLSQSPVWMLNSIERDALVGSVTCVRLCDICQTSHVSMVPKASSPRSARARTPGRLSSSQPIFVPEKYGSINNPVFWRMTLSAPAARRSVHCGAVRRSCQTMAL